MFDQNVYWNKLIVPFITNRQISSRLNIIWKVWRLYCQFVPEATRNSHRQHWAGHTVWSEGTLSRANCAMWRLLVKLANFAWKIESFLTCKRYHKFIHQLLVLKHIIKDSNNHRTFWCYTFNYLLNAWTSSIKGNSSGSWPPCSMKSRIMSGWHLLFSRDIDLKMRSNYIIWLKVLWGIRNKLSYKDSLYDWALDLNNLLWLYRRIIFQSL